MIGVALGSPGISPQPYGSTEAEMLSPDRLVESPHYASSPSNNPGSAQQKGSRWKTLGGLFGRRSGSQQPVFMPDHHAAPTTSVPNRRPMQLAPSATPTPVSQDHQKAPARNWIGREQLESSRAENNKSLDRKSSLKKPRLVKKQMESTAQPRTLQATSLRHKREGRPRPAQEDVIVGKSTSGAQTQHESLLHVDIPNVELDRFSIMFSGLLHANQQPTLGLQQPPERQPSLLARRQGSLQELYMTPLSDFHRPWMQTELTSENRAASPSKLPSFSLFPPSPPASSRSIRHPVRDRSPLNRSKTTPKVIAPEIAAANIKSQQDQFIVLFHSPREQASPHRLSKPESLHFRSPGLSQDESLHTQTPQPSPSALVPHPRSQDISLKTQCMPEDPLRKAAEVSIARQISVSQRQRQLLLQSAPGVAPQPVQKRVVNVRQASASRQSHHLILEGS
ncbi:MAG: hypothetical protein Q9222_000241 [Ikaeria aurantiellina]